ncbi:MAG TPA: PP2C family protein-serine/threonine phosphatase, partial [Phycisphaerae bacterium]|nr:PP2C family protein-serine/threonine phosphatase [Phycisphaerae bacterium]
MTAQIDTSVNTSPAEALACLEVWGGNEPVDTALRVPGLEVWVYAVPFANAAAGGDVHFVSSCGTGRIARLMVADVAGHGNEVADTARTLRGLIRRYMNHIDQRQFVRAMNERFSELTKTGRFATAVVMTYFSPDAELSVCNAGHPHPLIYQQATKTWRYLDTECGAEGIENIPLGITGDVAYEQFKVQLRPGDLVLSYTDSLVEAVCRDGSLLGTERLLELVQAVSAGAPTHVIHHLLAKMSVYGATLNDDVTLLLARCEGRSRGAGFLARLWAQVKFLGQVVTLRKNVP